MERAQQRQGVPDAQRLAQIDKDEGETHHHRRQGHGLAVDGDPAHGSMPKQIGRNQQNHRRSRHTDKKGEMADIEPPGHAVTETGDLQAVLELLPKAQHAPNDQHSQQCDPDGVTPSTKKHAVKQSTKKGAIAQLVITGIG